MPTTIYLASDHAGFQRKEELKRAFEKNPIPSFTLKDLGPDSEERTDYPDWADEVASRVDRGEGLGILVCGSGQGMCMRANRYDGVRAALTWTEEVARLARQHNDANIICFGGRLVDFDLTWKMTKAFFTTDFEGGRHADRIKKIHAPPKK